MPRGRRPEALSVEALWVVLCLLGLAIIVDQPRWGQLSFYLIWVSFALLYGLRAWYAHRRMAADAARSAVSAENERLLTAQRRFLMDASHQLKTPITIALGHAELLARELAGLDGQRDIHVVVGELNRLKSLSERLLLIAASENPDFLRPEPLELPLFAVEQLHRWRPAATRRWLVGRLDHVTVAADPDRLALALDALLENAVQHTAEHDLIRVSVLTGEPVAAGGYFKTTTPVAFKLKVRAACDNLPHVQALPIAKGVPLSSAIDVVSYNTTGAGVADIARLEECVDKFQPQVQGVNVTDSSDDS